MSDHGGGVADRVSIRSILLRPDDGAGLSGQRVRICGLVKTGRLQKKNTLAFLEVKDGSCEATLQVLVDASSLSSSDVFKKLVLAGTCVIVDGCLKIPPEGKDRKQKIELSVEKVIHVGTVDPDKYPIHKTNLSLEYLRDYPHLRARDDTIATVGRMQDELDFAIRFHFRERGIRNVKTPIITSSDCEGGSAMFQVTTLIKELSDKLPTKEDGKIDYSQDFFGRPAFLSVSGQLQLESVACARGSNVFTFGPAFRAENSHTSRHLAEFWMVEAELAPADLDDTMNRAEELVKYMCTWLVEECSDDLEFMAKNVDKECIKRLESVVSEPFARVTYTKAIKLLEEAVAQGKAKFEKQVKWGIDLSFEHERYLTEVEYEKKPVIVYNYPKDIKAFYMRLNDDEETVAAFDVLVPKVGELIGGNQREERYDELKKRMEEMKIPIEPYKWYLDLRLHGTVPHSGFGLGLERMLLFATGLDNIRDVIPFPRYPGRADL